MNFIKAKHALYDSGKGMFINGQELVISLNQISRFERDYSDAIKRSEEVIGTIWQVTTTTDDVSYSIKVTSKSLDAIMEQAI